MTTAPTSTPAASRPRPTQQPTAPSRPRVGGLFNTHFLLRRLHSLTGIVPIGFFVILHLFTNVQMLFGDFQHEVQFIHNLPALLILELSIWIPLAFHAILGIYYIFQGRGNSHTYRYGGNLRYTLQRWTAWVSLIFIFYHVATLRWGWTFGGFADTPFVLVGVDDQQLGHATTAMALQHGPLDGWLTTALYLIGTLAVIYHWSNGLWTAAITWGITTSVASMRRWGYVCAGMGIVLTLFGVGAIYAARTYGVTEADLQAIQAYRLKLEAGELPEH